MSYSGVSDWSGDGRLSAAGIDQAFRERGQRAAPRYAPGGIYREPPPGIGQAIIDLCQAYGVNADLVAAQIGHECAWWQSAIVRDKNNPSGLGATNDAPYQNAVTFATPFEGIRATVAHLLSYIKGDANPLRAYSVRHEILRSVGYLGVVRVLSDLNGRWAYPGTTYGQSIANTANVIVADYAHITDEPEIPAPPFRLSHIPWGNRNRPGGSFDKDVVIIHETANSNPGANAEMHRQFTHNGGGTYEVSFHAVADDREVIELLPDPERSFANSDGFNGPGNTHGLALELCVNSGSDWQRTLRHGAWWTAQKLKQHNLGLDQVKQHYNYAPDKKNCPARLRAFGWVDFLGMVGDELRGKPAAPKRRIDPVTSQEILGGFRAYYERLEDLLGGEDALLLIGHPLGEETTDPVTGRRVQYFERARFEWHPDTRPADWDVLLGRLGAEALERRPGVGRLETPVHGSTLRGGFGAYYRWLESRLGGELTELLVGLVLTDEVYDAEAGCWVLYTERCRWEWHPGLRPARWDVVGSRLGAEALETVPLV